MEFKVTCTYCGHVSFVWAYVKTSLSNLSCTKCKDKHLRIQQYEKVDYYVGCPPFPEKIPVDLF